MSKILLIIDPQNDFVDPRGSLYVKGAEKVVENLCKFLDKEGDKYDQIAVTQDSHHKIHISFKDGWTNKPEPFSTVVVKVGSDFELCAKDLEIAYYGDTGVNIWPDHCVIGTWGHCFPENLSEALGRWEIRNRKPVIYQRKGENCGYEAYSAYTDESFGKDKPGWRRIKHDELDICGFCKDICVAETIKDLVTKTDENVCLLDSYSATLNSDSENLKILKELEEKGQIKITV